MSLSEQNRALDLGALKNRLQNLDRRGGLGYEAHEIVRDTINTLDAIARAEGVADLLKDPKVVHINMLRGGIAKLTPAQIGHLYRGDEAAEVIREVARQNPEAEGVAALQQAGEPVAWMIAHKLTGHMQSFRKNFYLNADLVRRQTDYLRSRSDVAEVETTPLYASPLPQQTALVEEGVEKIIAQHEPAACGEGTPPSPSGPPRSDGGEGCKVCGGERWVCENHPEQAWNDDGCMCGAGKPCAACNPSGWPLSDGGERLALAMLGNGTGNFAAEAHHLHKILGEFDWYALAGSGAERELHRRLTRLVSCDEFLSAVTAPSGQKGDLS